MNRWIDANGRAVALVASLALLIGGFARSDSFVVAAGVVLVVVALALDRLREVRWPGGGFVLYGPQLRPVAAEVVERAKGKSDELAKAVGAGRDEASDAQPRLLAGFHAAWVARSADATARPGELVQCAAVYQNIGTLPWIKGERAADLATVPIGDRRWRDEGWAEGWLTEDVYARQANDIVAPGALGSWVWRVRVPVGARPGVYVFNYQPVVWDTVIGPAAAIRIAVLEK